MPRFALALLLIASSAYGSTTITLLHFSDYHSHALPHYSEGRDEQGGIARAIGFLERAKRRGAIVFSGGDMINQGSPSWSDKYRCAEWTWLNGIVDAMAYGNHDSDYGPNAFQKCCESLQYPIISANVTDARGTPIFRRHLVVERRGIRIGVLAVAGADFAALVKPSSRPAAESRFTDPVDAAREVVRELRESEHVDAVVMIGHEHREDDYALARRVPGIDVIFGSHTHLKEPLTRIEGTTTWYISPFQYLTYIARVQMTFEGRRLVRVTGRLVPVDERIAADPRIACRVASMQRALKNDPEYRPFFAKIGEAAVPLSVDGQNVRDSVLGDLVTDVMRRSTGADVALSTASSFRQSIPRGAVALEGLGAALPYDNEIIVYGMTAEQLKNLLAFSVSRRGTDAFAQVSGVRLSIDREGQLTRLDLEPGRVYSVATTDFLARVAAGYRDFFSGLTPRATGLRVRDEVRTYIAEHSPVSAVRDGRIDSAVHP